MSKKITPKTNELWRQNIYDGAGHLDTTNIVLFYRDPETHLMMAAHLNSNFQPEAMKDNIAHGKKGWARILPAV